MKKLKECFKILEFMELGNERGTLVVIEGNRDVPLEIKRVFYMYGTDKEMIRGSHANKNSAFVLINVAGKSKIRIDNGSESTVVELNNVNCTNPNSR